MMIVMGTRFGEVSQGARQGQLDLPLSELSAVNANRTCGQTTSLRTGNGSASIAASASWGGSAFDFFDVELVEKAAHHKKDADDFWNSPEEADQAACLKIGNAV